MTLTMSCHACGQDRSYEYAMGDRSDLCWREACKKKREARADEYHARMYLSHGPAHAVTPIAGPAAPLADLPFTLTPEVATTPSAARLQRPLRFKP